MNPTPPPLLVESSGPVLRVTLNRPRVRNALDAATIDALDAVLTSASSNSRVRALVITGAGGSFSAGGDLAANFVESGSATEAIARQRRFTDVAHRLLTLPLPTIAAVDGPAIGAGFSLALACDQIIVGSDALLGLGFLQVGLPPDLFAAVTVQRRAGWSVAVDLIYSGRRIGAREAENLRLATAATDLALPVALERAEQWAQLPPGAFAATKTLLQAAWPTIDGYRDLETMFVGTAAAADEFRELTERFRTPPRRTSST